MKRRDEDECCGPADDFAVDPPMPPEWLVRAEMRDLAVLPPNDPVRIRRLRALWGLPNANPDPKEQTDEQ